MSMAGWLSPDLVVRALEDVDLEWLASKGVRAILLDVDNTLTLWRSEEVSPEKALWVERAKEGFSICLVSNTIFGRRLRRLAERFGVPHVACWGVSRKPFPWGVKRALQKTGVTTQKACIVGDQIFADVLAGKLAGLVTVLVDPIDPASEFILTRLARLVERPLRRSWSKAEEKPP
jgi:HAD superfamily phosphatase (TIGR01668 family)